MPTVLEIADEYRRQLDRGNLAAIAQLTRAYRQSLDRIFALLDLLMLELDLGTITRTGLYRMRRYIALVEQINVELIGLQTLTGNTIETGSRLWLTRGELAAREMLSATLTQEIGLAAQFNRLPVGAIETLMGFLSPTGPLYDRLRQLAPTTFQSVIDTMTDGIIRGLNPREIARRLTAAYGQGLTDAVRMVRTANIYAYREANRAGMVANSEVVTGWSWFATLDGRVCAACVAMHGTEHALDERLNGHHNCRCVPIPIVPEYKDVTGFQSGEEWFKAQSAQTQRAILGPGKLDAWNNGAFPFSALAGQHQDSVYGWMRVETPLKELIGVD